MSNPYRPVFAGAWVTLAIQWEPSSFGQTLMMACPAARERALDEAAMAADVDELEVATETIGKLPRGDGDAWRWRTRWIAGRGYLGAVTHASLAAACAIAPENDDQDDAGATGRTRS